MSGLAYFADSGRTSPEVREGPLPDSCADNKVGAVSGIQLIKQRLRLLQIERVKPLGEPAVDRSE
jgi:hypothetical protein